MRKVIVKRLKSASNLFYLSFLHALNDGFEASYLLLLPFIAQDIQINLTQVGLLGTLFASLRAIFALPSAYLAKKIGTLRLLLVTFFIGGLGFFTTGLSPSFNFLIFTFILGGLGYSMFHVTSFSLVARIADKKIRGKEMGNFTAMGNVGRISISTILTFIVVYIGWRLTSIFYGLIAMAAAVSFYLIFLPKREASMEEKETKTEVPFLKIMANFKYIMSVLSCAIDSFASASLFLFLPFLLLKRNVDPLLLGFFTASFFLGNVLGNAYLGRLLDRYGSAKVFIASEILMAVFIFLLANSPSLILIIISSIILGVFTKGTVPVVQTMLTESVEHHGNYEKAFSINSLLANVGAALAPIFLGFVSDKLGIVMAFNAMAIAAIIASLPAFAFQSYHSRY